MHDCCDKVSHAGGETTCHMMHFKQCIPRPRSLHIYYMLEHIHHMYTIFSFQMHCVAFCRSVNDPTLV